MKQKRKEVSKIPNLRFKDNAGNHFSNWEFKKLGKVCEINPKNSILPNSFIYIDLESVANGVLLKEDRLFKDEAPSRAQRLLKRNDILFQMVRPYQMNNLYFDREGEYVASTGYAQIRTAQNPQFIFQYLHTHKFVDEVIKKCTGTSYPAINSTDLSNIKISVPLIAEQSKIANFLSLLDDHINTQNKIIEELESLLQGFRQKLFSRELKFTDNNGNDFPEWEEKNLGHYLKHKSVRNKSFEVIRVLSVSNSKGFILQSEQFDNHRVASKDVSNYKIVKKNDIAYNPSRINVGSIATLKDFEEGIVSPMYVVFSLKNTLNLTFFENLITTHLFKHLVKIGCSGSVRDSLNFEDLESFKLKLPTLNEQIKIADFLISITTKISSERKILAEFENQKKYFLQQLFI